jgi:hypothetical protein
MKEIKNYKNRKIYVNKIQINGKNIAKMHKIIYKNY